MRTGANEQGRRPAGVDDATVAAVGKLSEAYEYLIRARGFLYSWHQLMGRTDLLLGDAVDKLREAGHGELADEIEREHVGRNVIDGRWSFQVVEEFDDDYFGPITAVEQQVRERLTAGVRHVFESEMKDERRTPGKPGHERRPPAAWRREVEVEVEEATSDR
jgi:hypothetical protein